MLLRTLCMQVFVCFICFDFSWTCACLGADLLGYVVTMHNLTVFQSDGNFPTIVYEGYNFSRSLPPPVTIVFGITTLVGIKCCLIVLLIL